MRHRHQWTRRELLRTSAAAAVGAGLGGWSGVAPGQTAQATSRPLAHPDDAAIEKLAERIIAAAPGEVVDLVAGELDRGLSREQLHAANFVAGIRFQGHHYAYVAHPVLEVSNAIPADQRLLPIFYHVGALKVRIGKPRLHPVDKGLLPPIHKADAFFQAAMAESDPDMAVRSFLALAREHGPQQAYGRLWMYGAERNHNSGGHTAISVANTFRTMQAIGWRCPETVLQFAVEDSAVGKPGGSNLRVVNQTRAAQLAEATPRGADLGSDRAAVLELLALYRQGDPDEACATTFQWLRQGRVGTASVWDAVFLTTAELVTRYTWVGSKMLAGHSITCANAMHFMFRTVSDAATRWYALLEAVEWTTSFLNRERARPALRERDLFQVTPAALPGDQDSLESIFEMIPVRRRRGFSPVLLPQNDTAQERALAWATKHDDHLPFFRRALELLCIKSTTEVHDLKYPLALFENYRFVSPEWRKHLLAASVYVLHGTRIEDSPTVLEARERLRG